MIALSIPPEEEVVILLFLSDRVCSSLCKYFSQKFFIYIFKIIKIKRVHIIKLFYIHIATNF